MIEKYTISFSVEADLKDKDELTAMIWTLLKIGKQALGEVPMTVPALKEINVEVGACDEPYHPFKLYLYTPCEIEDGPANLLPTCSADHFHELFDAISDYSAQGKKITVVYQQTLDSRRQTIFSRGSGKDCFAWTNNGFLKEHPELK